MSITFEDGIIKTPALEFDEHCGGIGNIYFSSLKRYSERIALINATTDEFYTYSDLLERCVRTALALQQRGFKEKDLLATCSNKENLDANVPIIAGQFLGLITVSFDPGTSVNECVELMEQAQPKIIFIAEKAKNLITQSIKTINAETEIVLFGKDFQNEFLKEQENEKSFKPVFIKNLQETCAIHFSSGSTGLPKPICLSHYCFTALVPTFDEDFIPDIPKKQFANKPIGPVTLTYANWYAVTTSYELVLYMAIGGCRLLRDRFDVKEIWTLIEKFSILNIYLAPVECIELASTTKSEKDISSVTDIISIGYVVHTDYINSLNKLFPDTSIHQVYAMTECGLVTIFVRSNPKHLKLLAERPDSCGLPIPGLYYKVIDLDTGKKCGRNQPGELYLKGKKLFNGFFNKDASESFDSEGYFRTGDLVSFDEDFRFYVLDRIKTVIIWNRSRIFPFHIEKILMEHQSVDNAVVIGIPHKSEGQRPMGVVILKEDAPKVTEDELVKYVNERVEDHRRLRAGVKFMKKFPETVTGKIKRLQIKEMFS